MFPCYHCDKPGRVWMGDMLVCFEHWSELKCEGDKLEPFVPEDEHGVDR